MIFLTCYSVAWSTRWMVLFLAGLSLKLNPRWLPGFCVLIRFSQRTRLHSPTNMRNRSESQQPHNSKVKLTNGVNLSPSHRPHNNTRRFSKRESRDNIMQLCARFSLKCAAPSKQKINTTLLYICHRLHEWLIMLIPLVWGEGRRVFSVRRLSTSVL